MSQDYDVTGKPGEFSGKYVWKLTYWSGITQEEVSIFVSRPRDAIDSLRYLGNEERLISLVREINPNWAKPRSEPLTEEELRKKAERETMPEPLSR